MTRHSTTKGYIYCLSNRSFKQNVFKVGFTVHNPYLRADQLYKTGVPTPFDIVFAKHVHDYTDKEKKLHTILDNCKYRINPKREFFECSIQVVKSMFDLMEGEYVECQKDSVRKLHVSKEKVKTKEKTIRKSILRKAKQNVQYKI